MTFNSTLLFIVTQPWLLRFAVVTAVVLALAALIKVAELCRRACSASALPRKTRTPSRRAICTGAFL